MMVYLSWGEGLSRARSNWRHAVAVTLPIIGESNKIKSIFRISYEPISYNLKKNDHFMVTIF